MRYNRGMENKSTWLVSIHTELDTARKAREDGNDGRARVCARRAAGIAIGEYFRRQNYPDPGPSAMGRLKLLMNLPGISDQNRDRAYRLTVRVTPDHELPFEADLIEDAKSLIHELLQVQV